jgi:hypothetical protein
MPRPMNSSAPRTGVKGRGSLRLSNVFENVGAEVSFFEKLKMANQSLLWKRQADQWLNIFGLGTGDISEYVRRLGDVS